MYNCELDLWFEMPELNVGRHYHTSCTFNDRFIYVFCGIENKSRKYINSIEFYDNDKKTNWRLIELSPKLFPERQGCGVHQKDESTIIIFGGFNGRFLKDSYLFNVNSNKLTATNKLGSECFMFQMPVCYDSKE